MKQLPFFVDWLKTAMSKVCEIATDEPTQAPQRARYPNFGLHATVHLDYLSGNVARQIAG